MNNKKVLNELYAEPLFTEEWLKGEDNTKNAFNYELIKNIEDRELFIKLCDDILPEKLTDKTFSIDECLRLVNMCDTVQLFFEMYPNYFVYCCITGLMRKNKTQWFNKYRFSKTYWYNFSNCYIIAKYCSIVSHLGFVSQRAYEYMKNNDWLNLYDWIETKDIKPHGYWTKDLCYKVAKECDSKTEFGKRYPTAYNISKKNKWIKDYTWFKTPIPDGIDPSAKINWIYAYEDFENKVVYVGRTYDSKRHNKHNYKSPNGECDRLKRYYESIGIKEIPEPRILIDNLNLEESLIYEDVCAKIYSYLGWNVLNKAKMGKGTSSVGYQGVKWTKEKCYEEAQKYEILLDFVINSATAYSKSVKYGWLKDYTWLDRLYRTNITYEECYNIALQYEYLSDFYTKELATYSISLKRNWLKDYIWLKNKKEPNNTWTKEKCYEEAQKYTRYADFSKYSVSAYTIAWRNGWLDDYVWLDKGPEIVWTYEECEKLSHNYKTTAEFNADKSSVYRKCVINGWIEKFTWLIPTHKKTYTEEECYIEALNYNSEYLFKKHNRIAFRIAKENGWLVDYIWFTPKKVKLTKDYCYSIAIKYTDYRLFTLKESSVYKKAKEEGWIDEYIWLILKKPRRNQ